MNPPDAALTHMRNFPLKSMNAQQVKGVAPDELADWIGNPDNPIFALENKLSQNDANLNNWIGDIADVIEWLREDKQYAAADRLRQVAGNMARARRTDLSENPNSWGLIAAKW